MLQEYKPELKLAAGRLMEEQLLRDDEFMPHAPLAACFECWVLIVYNAAGLQARVER